VEGAGSSKKKNTRRRIRKEKTLTKLSLALPPFFTIPHLPTFLSLSLYTFPHFFPDITTPK
jgi:hypothetical protein